MSEVGVAWLLWIVVLGGGGFALGSFIVFTMPARFIMRFAGAVLVFVALVLAIGLNVVGLIPALFGLLNVFLLPVLTAIGLRYLWSDSKRKN